MTGKLSKWMALLVAAGCVSAAGCGSNPPCVTDISDVEAARTEAQSAEARLDALRQEKGRLEKEIAAEEGRRTELERRKAELEAKIAELEG